MLTRIQTLVVKSLNTRVTPLAYAYSLQGIFTGLAFTFFQFSPGVQNTIMFKYGALVGVSIWGIFLLSSTLATFTAMVTKNKYMTMAGAAVAFSCWVMALVLYTINGFVFFLAPLALSHMLCYGYLYLASAMDRLWDYAPPQE